MFELTLTYLISLLVNFSCELVPIIRYDFLEARQVILNNVETYFNLTYFHFWSASGYTDVIFYGMSLVLKHLFNTNLNFVSPRSLQSYILYYTFVHVLYRAKRLGTTL